MIRILDPVTLDSAALIGFDAAERLRGRCSARETVALDDVHRLASDLDRFLDQLLDQVHPDHLTSAERDEPRVRHVQSTRRQQLERYVDAMSTAQRLRLAGALHLLSGRLDEDLADPDQRAAHASASRRPY